MNADQAEITEECIRCGRSIALFGEVQGPYYGWIHVTHADAVPPHKARPKRVASLECAQRFHHFSGSWCETCQGWG